MAGLHDAKRKEKEVMCVVGAAGYIGSSLVKTLLRKGFTVHATLRDPGNRDRLQPLISLEGAVDRLKIFKADLYHENSFDSAIEGCHGVFHVATPLVILGMSEEETEAAAVKGVLNVLRSCTRAQTVKRVVYTSSVAAACPVQQNGEITATTVDESTWTNIEFFKNHLDIEYKKHDWHLYFIYKTVAERTALQYGETHGLQVASVGPSTVGGPFITRDFPGSCSILLSFFIDDESICKWINYFGSVAGHISLVHINDVCEAHVFVMQHPCASGRHICSVASMSVFAYWDFLRRRYPHLPLKYQVKREDEVSCGFAEASSKKLRDMGFVFNHGFEEIVEDIMADAKLQGLLPP